jgi:hypothetical protein
VNTTSYGLGAETVEKLTPSVLIVGYFFIMSNVKTTSALVNGFPSLHFTPWRSWNVRVLSPLENAYEVASHG